MAARVTIMGAGNGGHALGMHLAMHGCEVLIFAQSDHAGGLVGIRDRGGIEGIGKMVRDNGIIHAHMSGFGRIARCTTDPKEAMEYSDIICMVVPSFAQASMFTLILPYLRDDHVICLLPGNFGSLVLGKMMEDQGISRGVTVVEANSIPHACRVVGPGQVFILGAKDALEVAALPASTTTEAVRRLQEVFPLRLVPLNNVLEAGFSNMNMIAHVAATVLNIGLAESRGGQFYFYKEGMSESVARVQQAMDDERLAVGSALHLRLESFVEVIRTMYHLDIKDIHDFAINTPIHNSFGYDFPKSPKERYVSEDCPYLLVPVEAFGRLAGVETPTISSIVTIASVMNSADYRTTGRTPESMGISGERLERVISYIQHGR